MSPPPPSPPLPQVRIDPLGFSVNNQERLDVNSGWVMVQSRFDQQLAGITVNGASTNATIAPLSNATNGAQGYNKTLMPDSL